MRTPNIRTGFSLAALTMALIMEPLRRSSVVRLSPLSLYFIKYRCSSVKHSSFIICGKRTSTDTTQVQLIIYDISILSFPPTKQSSVVTI